MFEAFKRLFSKPASPPPAAAPVTQERIPAPSLMYAAPAPASGPSPQQVGDKIALPLNEILSRLPIPIAGLVLIRPGGTFSFSASIALEQLRTGAVRIPFSQLRQGSPPGTFANNATHDDSLIDLPLPLVLAAVGSGGLARRTDQKRIEVPDEVKSVFGAKMGKLNPAAAVASAPAAAPSAPKPAPPAVTPIPAAVVPKPVTPVVPPATAPRQTTSIASGSTAPKPTTSIASSTAAPKPASPLPFATARPSPPTSAVAPVPASEAVVTTIDALSEAWPDPIRHEIQQFRLGSALISIPVTRLEAVIKTGRVVFTWAELCGWLNMPMPPSANGESSLELPLKILAPLFLAIPRAAKPRKVVSVGENVPDLFAGQSRPTAPAPTTALPATPLMAPTPQVTPAGASTVLGEIFGQPSKMDWTPAEIVQRISALTGIAGALLASKDGLLVAGQMPAPLKAEMMAAFLPQMFTHIGGRAEEVELGTLRALKLTTSLGDCAVFQAGELCLAVFGLPGQTLPEPALERIAAELAQPQH